MRRSLLASALVASLLPGRQATAEEPAKPDPELQKIERFVGEWTYVGEIKKNPYVPAEKYTGTVSARWILGGFFQEIRMKDDATGGAPTEVYEIDGYDPTAKKFFARQFITGGVTRVWNYTWNGDAFSMETDKTVGGKPYRQRITTRFAKDGQSYVENAEISEDGKKWVPYGETKYSKMTTGKK